MPSNELASIGRNDPMNDTYKRIYTAVKRIPQGRVATYGQIAVIAEASGPRQIGYALHALPAGSGVPWHRVINAQGRVSLRTAQGWGNAQRAMLEAEGVVFDERDRVVLDRFQWSPKHTFSKFTARSAKK